MKIVGGKWSNWSGGVVCTGGPLPVGSSVVFRKG